MKQIWNKITIFAFFFGLVAYQYFSHALTFHAVDGDNLIGLTIGSRSIQSFFTSNYVSFFPAYRPVGQLSIWLQYQLVGLADLWTYFFVNIFLWVACCIIAGLFIYKYTKSYPASLLFSGLLFTDARAYAFISWITERQNSLMILFGLGAVVWTQHIVEKKVMKWWEVVGVCALLMASAFSKEYGLAFSLAIALYIFTLKIKDLRWLYIAPIIAICSYIIFRLFISSPMSGVGGYCEDMGYFFKQRFICYNELDIFVRIKQYLYNIVASFVGSFLPSLFNEYAMIIRFSAVNYVQLFFNVVVAWLFWRSRKNWPAQTFLMYLIIFNATLGFMVYRTRNQLVAIAPIYIGAGIGFYHLLKEYKRLPQLFMVGAYCYFIAWMITFGQATTEKLHKFSDYYDDGWLCGSIRSYPRDISADIVRTLGQRYKIETEGCIIDAQRKLAQ